MASVAGSMSWMEFVATGTASVPSVDSIFTRPTSMCFSWTSAMASSAYACVVRSAVRGFRGLRRCGGRGGLGGRILRDDVVLGRADALMLAAARRIGDVGRHRPHDGA